LGWTIGRNLRIDTRWATANAADIRRHAAELATLAPDVILAGGTSTLGPLLQATRSVPIVFTIVIDPVGVGYVDSLARPGGNITGFMNFEYGLSGKWLELLKQIAPGVTRAAVLRDATQGFATSQFAVIQAVAPSLRVEVNPVNIRDATEIERVVAAYARTPNEWRSDPDCERCGGASSRSNHHAGGPAQAARGLFRTFLRRRRRPGLLWA
jgi:putative ABC transport system substrate-binding protein